MISPEYKEIPFRRWKKNLRAHIGQLAPYAPFYIYIDQLDPDPETGQKIRYGILDFLTSFTHTGDAKTFAAGIRIRCQLFRLYQNELGIIQVDGKPDGVMDIYITNRKDFQDFLFMFGGATARFLVNGMIRRLKWFGWNNLQNLFRGDGTVVPDSEYNTEIIGPGVTENTHITEPGTYPTHNSDGSPIDSATHQPIDRTPWLTPAA